MMKTTIAAFSLSAALVVLLPATANADPGQDILNGLGQGFLSAFGSSGPAKPAPPKGGTYANSPACTSAAVQYRAQGYIAECNPVGGASSQYQLVILPK